MKNFTQKALMVVLSVFVLVGLFYGITTPVKAPIAAKGNINVTLHDIEGPAPVCNDNEPLCPL
ncbi:MAG TPA: hypothetical protein VFA71_10760 [Terriglobales bacterium]|nr:hypothetical protein [Terriglobales bacterium]